MQYARLEWRNVCGGVVVRQVAAWGVPVVAPSEVVGLAGEVPPSELVQGVVEVQAGPRDPSLAERISNALRDAFQLRMEVQIVQPGALPRFEFKARRWIKEKTGAE